MRFIKAFRTVPRRAGRLSPHFGVKALCFTCSLFICLASASQAQETGATASSTATAPVGPYETMNVDEGAFTLFADGDYIASAVRAKTAGGAENLALAARALNAEAYFEPDRKAARRMAKRALAVAEDAVDADPSLPEAHLQAAISYALWGANASPVKSFFSNLPGKARTSIDQALSLEPDNPWALSTSAAWRLEVHRFGGGAVYKADPAEGHMEFLASRAQAPKNVAVAYECALRILAAGRPEWRDDALACLDASITLSPDTQFERDLQARAHLLKKAVAEGDRALKAFVDQYG